MIVVYKQKKVCYYTKGNKEANTQFVESPTQFLVFGAIKFKGGFYND